jgi:hypothetical protein
MIHTIIDAIKLTLEEQGEPQSPCWLSSQMMEWKLWRASEHVVRAALEKDMKEWGEKSQFVKTVDGEYALRSWSKENETSD